MTPGSFIKSLKSSLSELGWYGPEEIRGAGRILLEELANIEYYKILTEPDIELAADTAERLQRAAERLGRGEPLQYILGYGWFYGYRFNLCEDVLIPRPETEELVRMVLDDTAGATEKPAALLDVFTGSGCIAWALQLKLPECRLYGCDISKKALDIASAQHPEGAERVANAPVFFKCDVLGGELERNAVGMPYDIIISNPPYVCESEKRMMRPNVLDYEPGLALFVPDENPLLFYEKIADAAARLLKRGGRVYFEINERFSRQVVQLLEKYGFGNAGAFNDLYGKPRFVKGVLE